MDFWGPFSSIVSKYTRRHKSSALLTFHLLLATIYRSHGDTSVFREMNPGSQCASEASLHKENQGEHLTLTTGASRLLMLVSGPVKGFEDPVQWRIPAWLIGVPLRSGWTRPSKGCAPLWCLLSFCYSMKESMTYLYCWNPYPNYSKLNIIKYT